MDNQKKQDNRIKLGRTSLNVQFLIGLFIFGWLMMGVYESLGKKRLGRFYFTVICICIACAINIEPLIGIAAPAVYIFSWIHANLILTHELKLGNVVTSS